MESEKVSPEPIQESVATEVTENITVPEVVKEQLKDVAKQLPKVPEKTTKPPAIAGKKSSAKGLITEVVCPKCGSNKVKEKVEANGQHKYNCKNCGKRWRVDPNTNGGND